ncbi:MULTISPECIES: hypothetical protein [Roseateles]|uniref:Uncharacterized protein n=1 Tax=Pelomonas aquatica TaxID=431058 RepID=A0ABU1Z8D9_9BURK|nr:MULTISPECIES: hypothetical protein [Roseateles]MDR7296265.1 hypothetical protein [Pelomonas aquatica]
MNPMPDKPLSRRKALQAALAGSAAASAMAPPQDVVCTDRATEARLA